MRDEKHLRQSLAELKQRRQQLAQRNRLLREYYREQYQQKAVRPATLIGASVFGATCVFLATPGRDHRRQSVLASETRYLILNLLDRQCERWLYRIRTYADRRTRMPTQSARKDAQEK